MGKKGAGRVRVKQVGPKMPANINPLADLAIPPEEMIHLPVQPNSNSGFLFWPMSEFPVFAVTICDITFVSMFLADDFFVTKPPLCR
jgi:hypothetical protein